MQRYELLFIDDDPSVLRSLGNYFEELGHSVHRAESGRAGLGLFEKVVPDVTVLDLHMPEMSGMQVLEKIRRKGGVVIMLTGQGEIQDAVEAMRLGAENFLTKPIEMSHLAVAVEKAAEKTQLRRENMRLRARLTPSLKRTLARVAVVAGMVAVSVGLGALIGSVSSEPEEVVIPVPLEGDTSLPTTEAPFLPGVPSEAKTQPDARGRAAPTRPQQQPSR